MRLFPFSAYECKKKWKTLRIQQRRIIIQKIKRKDSNSTVHWNCYDALKFLIPHMDWTTAEEKSIKIETDNEQNITDDVVETDDMNDNEENNTDENSNFSNMAQAETAIDAGHNIKENQETNQTLAIEKQQNLNQFVFTYVPTTMPAATQITNHEQYQTYADGASCSHQPMKNVLSNMCRNSLVSSNAQTQELITSTHKEMTTTQNLVSNSQVLDSSDPKLASVPPALNYFLMDVAVQMEKLNEIAQMEVKIDIHKLILDKLRSHKNLRNSSA